MKYLQPMPWGMGRSNGGTPHIYRPDEIARLMRAAGQLQPAGSIRPLMYSTLFGLLATTGMRISEALALQLDDVTADGLIIRQTKFQKSRLLPLHDTTQWALDDYLSVRVRLGNLDSALLVSITGKAPSYHTVVAVFLQLARSIGLRGEPGQPGPRIHDLRHTFAVRSLEQCRHDREAVARHVVALSTYLGHERIDALFAIEREINGSAPQQRVNMRTERSRPLIIGLESWLREQRARVSKDSDTGKAIEYSLKRWAALTRFLDDGRLCMSKNAADRELRAVAVGRRNWTFAGSDEGGRRAAAIYTLIATALCRPPNYAERARFPGIRSDRHVISSA